MTAVNSGLHELAGLRLPLHPYSGGHAVFMYSTAADGNVTLQLKEPDDLDRSSLAAMLARLQDDATFSISYQDTDILSDGSIDVLLGSGTANSGENDVAAAAFDLFDSSSGPDLTLSPETFTNSAEAFINDNSNSLGVSAENDAVNTCTTTATTTGTTPASAAVDEKKSVNNNNASEVVKLTVKRPRPKAASPNRQGPQQCQVCAKVFGNASALAKHKLTHSDERKYVCTMCGKAFKRQDHLNGHMLTHRNKKPYECKAEGCGKSYCDARSLRRHTENHHSSSTVNASSTTTTMSPAQGAASGDAASPHGSSCIQYAPAPTSSSPSNGKSQLQQLLATEPAKSGSGGNNDGLTKQQLDLIHQIMEQTQRQSQSASKPTTKPTAKPISKTPVKVQRVWTSTTQSSSSNKTSGSGVPAAASPQAKVTTTAPPSTSPANTPNKPGGEPKPVECNLCHRKFKNVPALNGHMRLHGGYFKKDAENKKCEKKDVNGPPLQTASISVRALIEEKIINKRITTNPQATITEDSTKTTAPPLFPLTVHSSSSSSSSSSASDLDAKITSFVVPAPPSTAQQPPSAPLPEKQQTARRHSDAEALNAIRASATQLKAEALADLILKREKVSVKRTTSDPGGQASSSQIIQFQTSDTFTLAGVSYQAEEGAEFLATGLQDEVFTQVQDSMLLQSVDPQQLASIQFHTDSLLQDQNDQQLQDIALEDYTNLQEAVAQSPSYQSTHSVNQELQAVLDSPLPESLAEFSTFHSANNLDLPSPNYQTQSPSITHSPLQSPLIRHDSPGFAYPTPPASHEGQSPCFGQNSSLSLQKQDFGQVIERGFDEPPQASSPLSAAFFTSTMSSSAAVEEALEEVLPGETISSDDIYPLSNSPPPQSPLSVGLTPVPSPLSTSAPPATNSFAASSQHTIAFPMSSPHHYTLQSQMMPNSEDPLLSSSPKDFAARKRFEFNGVPLKLISNNALVDLNNGNFAGILVDANGDIKLIQTGGGGGAGALQGKNFILANAINLQNHDDDVKNNQRFHKVLKTVHCTALPSTKQVITRPNDAKQTIEVKKEDNNDVFLSPRTIPAASPIKISRKRPRTEPLLQLPVLYQSKLRATRVSSKPHHQGFSTVSATAVPFTPQPILNPQRAGTGLFASTTTHKNKLEAEDLTMNSEPPIPESDATPHVNVGQQFQCKIPPFTSAPNRDTPEPIYEDLLWDPGIKQCSAKEVDMYLDFACCAAVPGGGRNKEYAMHLLHMCGGNIHDALLKLMQPSPMLPKDHPLLSYQYSETEKWTTSETELFQKALLKYDKDFRRVAKEIGTKTIKQCIQFYYLWKKVCTDDYRKLKYLREKRNHHHHHHHHHQANKSPEADVIEDKIFPDAKLLGILDSGSPMPTHETRNFTCEFTDCSASFNSRAALNGHIRIHGGTARNSPTPLNSEKQRTHHHHSTVSSTTLCHPDTTEDYPCKICGK